MNIKTILNILSGLATSLGLTLLAFYLISLAYGEYDQNGFLLSAVLVIVVCFPIWLISRKNRALTNKDGFFIVAFAWILTAVIGALPFYFTGF